MDKLIDRALGIQPRAIELGAARLELIAGNLANADTPGFKARDIDFRATMESLLSDPGAPAMRVTEARHLDRGGMAGTPSLLYRTPNIPSLDGNTVDTQLEQSAFAEATIRYQAAADFLDARIQGLRKALRGE